MNLTQFRPAGPQRVEGSTALDDAEALHEFDSESEPRRPAAPEPAPPQPKGGVTVRIAPAAILPIALAALFGVIAGAAGVWAYQRLALARSGASLRLETSVPGVEVIVSGKALGRTPLSLTLAPGSYPVRLAGEGGGRRDFTVDLGAGTSVVRHVDMPPVAPAANALGSLHVQTEPGRLTVFVDGVERGTSPLTVAELTPGAHHVAVRGDGTTVRRTVTIQASERTVLVVTPVDRAAPATAVTAAGGWVSLASPIALVIKEAGKVLGTTDAERLMLTAGEHNLELTNDALGFQVKRTVRVEAGKSAVVKVEPPNGVLSINAQPWAEVWVDGQRIGETPIGNLARPIGPHDVVLRHPDLGERRETVTVTLRQPARLGVDMRKK
jgi:PEGA domain-containing protein